VVLTQKSLANAITYLNGFTKTLDKATGIQTIYDGAGNVYTGPMEQPVPAKVYLRAITQIGDVESSRCYSNAVELSQVKWFINFREAGFIYLIGKPQGWDIANGSMMLFENDDEIGTKIYHGHFNIDANPLELGFRFYTELGDWDKGSIGAAAADGDNKNCEFNAEGIYSGDLVMGKGNFQFPTWPGGEMYIIVDLNSMKITVSDHEL
ncbi:MAG: hypothetical protein J6D01_01730, partial [Muribaculaceae bacterium]|nr:hypothetical protein [Muribaculaceae bacterium]